MNNASTPYRAAIIGCGRIAGGYDRAPGGDWTVTHAGAYRACPSTELVAAADTDPAALAGFAACWGLKAQYSDYRRMLALEQPDVVSLCLPPEGHLEAFQAACEAGVRAIFLEKPVAANLAEAQKMPDLAAGRPVAVNYFRRWNPSFEELKKELERGLYGRPLRATVHYVKDVDGNASHFVDLLRWFFGEPEAVRHIRLFDGAGAGTSADFEIAFPEGILATFLHVPAVKYVLHEVDIFTAKARVIIGQRGQIIRRHELVEEPHSGLFQILDSTGDVRETEWRNCTLRAVEELVGCLEGRGTPSCRLDDGIQALRICDRVLSEVPLGGWAST